MERDRRLALMVGSFLLVALAALAVSILSLTSERGVFLAEYRVLAAFENVQGLQRGAPVWLAGKEIGRVEEIRFQPRGEAAPLLVILALDVDVKEFIRADSVASIGTIGVLGDSYVELSVGQMDSPVLEPGDAVQTVAPVNINQALAKVTRAVESFTELSENLNEAVVVFAEEDGAAKAARALEAGSDIILAVKEGPGLLHGLIYDPYEGEGIGSIERSLVLLEGIMAEIATGSGILHTLIYDSPEDQDVVMKMMSAGARLNSILEKVDRGEGTVGLLVNDPSLYEDMQTLLGGAQRSLMIRSMIKMAVDKDD